MFKGIQRKRELKKKTELALKFCNDIHSQCTTLEEYRTYTWHTFKGKYDSYRTTNVIAHMLYKRYPHEIIAAFI